MENFNLLSSHWSNGALDIVLVVALIIMALLGARKGLIGSLLGVASTALAMVVVFALAKPFSGWTNGLFGLGDGLKASFTNSFSTRKGLNLDISGVGVETALTQYDVPKIFKSFILDRYAGADLPAGTTLASLLGAVTADWATVFLCGIVLFFLTKLVFRLLRGVLNGVINRIPVLGPINAVLGSLIGVLKLVLILSAILALLTLIPVLSIGEYMSQSVILGALYNHNPLFVIIGWIF